MVSIPLSVPPLRSGNGLATRSSVVQVMALPHLGSVAYFISPRTRNLPTLTMETVLHCYSKHCCSSIYPHCHGYSDSLSEPRLRCLSHRRTSRLQQQSSLPHRERRAGRQRRRHSCGRCAYGEDTGICAATPCGAGGVQ
jgi:hypothetical protein